MINIKLLLVLFTFSLLTLGCTNQQNIAPKQVAPKVKKHKTKTHRSHVAPPKKEVELKEVEDTNFSSDYMYPQTDKKSVKETETDIVSTVKVPVAQNTIPSISKEECISMIGQEKFDKYAQMYGGEEASIKKCKMLKTL